MGFFKEFKDDFSQAVNELMPGEDELTEKEDTLENDDMVVNTLDAEVDTESELSKLNGLLEQVTEQPAPQAIVKPQHGSAGTHPVKMSTGKKNRCFFAVLY